MDFLKLTKQLAKPVIPDVVLVKKKLLALLVQKEEYCPQSVYALQINLKIAKVNVRIVDSLVKPVKVAREIALQVMKMMEMDVNKENFWLKQIQNVTSVNQLVKLVQNLLIIVLVANPHLETYKENLPYVNVQKDILT